MRAEARGGSGEGILGWHCRTISDYTWCVTEKGPQRKWLHKIKKSDTPECHCHQEQSGKHLVGCRLLVEARGLVEKEEMREWETRHARDRKKKKGDVGIEKEKEKEEGERLTSFFSTIYDFFNPVPVVPAVPVNVFVPDVLPARFVPVPVVPASSVPSVAVSHQCITTRSTA